MAAMLLQGMSLFLPILLGFVNFILLSKRQSAYSSAWLNGAFAFLLLWDCTAVFFPKLIWQNKWYIYMVSAAFVLCACAAERYIRRTLHRYLKEGFETQFQQPIASRFYVLSDVIYAQIDGRLVAFTAQPETEEDELHFLEDGKLCEKEQEIRKILQSGNRFRLF